MFLEGIFFVFLIKTNDMFIGFYSVMTEVIFSQLEHSITKSRIVRSENDQTSY